MLLVFVVVAVYWCFCSDVVGGCAACCCVSLLLAVVVDVCCHCAVLLWLVAGV